LGLFLLAAVAFAHAWEALLGRGKNFRAKPKKETER